MDDFKKQELLFEIQRCKELLNSNVLTITESIFTQSAFIEILIRLNDVLQKLNTNNSRITWNDDVKTDEGINDITDLVNKLRNAACHIDSGENYTGNGTIKFVFNRISGKIPNAVQLGNIILGNEYRDDIAFYYGDKRIYLRRHVERLLKELPLEISKLK